MLTYERLREVLHYDPETGVWTWRVKMWRSSAGSVAGCRRRDGYRTIKLDGVAYLSHRLAWLYMTGGHPKGQIDHINGARDDIWSNLRDVSVATNLQNLRSAKSNNTTGYLGVSRNHAGGFRARIQVDGRQCLIGHFDTPEQAHEAYLAAKRRLHPGNTI